MTQLPFSPQAIFQGPALLVRRQEVDGASIESRPLPEPPSAWMRERYG